MSSEIPPDARAAKLKAWTDKLPPALAARILRSRQVGSPLESPEPSNGFGLSSLAVQALADRKLNGDTPADKFDATEASYLVTVLMDGAAPVVKQCKTPERAAAVLAELCGKDGYAFVAFGYHMPITTGDEDGFGRSLVLPNGEQIITIPSHKREKPVIEDKPTGIDLEYQTDGYLGPVFAAKGLHLEDPVPPLEREVIKPKKEENKPKGKPKIDPSAESDGEPEDDDND